MPVRPPANSVTMAIAVGRQPPRPKPARKRKSPSCQWFCANAQASVSSETVDAAFSKFMEAAGPVSENGA